MEGKTTNNGNSIESFYIDMVILITGVTGFVGQALIEKLLRSCPRVSTIYVLIRSKRGKTVQERLEQLKKFSVFDRLRIEDPSALDKIYPIEGDISLPNLGLTPKDMNMLMNTVNIVFHSAATVRFDEPLKVAVNMNTIGTDRMIDLCKEIKNLKSFVYVSTAYSNANRSDIEEVIYNTKLKPSTVIDMCANLDDKTLDVMEKLIMEGHPNTYTYTKNLAEQVIRAKESGLPVSIVRPSIIGAALEEPFPGWVYGFAGLTGVMTEAGRGTFRYFLAKKHTKLDVIPVDYVVDTIICVPWHRSMQTNNSLLIYNCTNNAVPLRVMDLVQYGLKHVRKEPSKYTFWYPDLTVGTNFFMYKFVTITQNYLLAFIMDIIFRLRGMKPINMDIAKRLDRGVVSVSYFCTHEWNFHRNNMHDLAKKVEMLKNSSNFNTDISDRDVESYTCTYLRGIRKYLLNENIETVDVRTRLLILYCLHRFLQISTTVALLAMVVWIILTVIKTDNLIGTSLIGDKS